MKRIGLTQRVEVISGYNERRDCLDQNWVKLLIGLDYVPVILPNIDSIDLIKSYLDEMSLDGVILTGGNDLIQTKSPRVAIERDQFETALIDYCCLNEIPILGVCRGMQMLNIYFGGQLQSVSNHVTQSHQINFIDGRIFSVNSYHDWGITANLLSIELEALGHSEDGLVEYCKHKKMPITAMMWHPERDNKDQEISLKIIKETFS